LGNKKGISTIVPKKYKDATDLFEFSGLEDFEGKIRKLNEQTSAAWFVEALAIYGILYDNEVYAESGLTWKQYKSETRKRLGLDYRDFTEYFAAGKFLYDHGKELFAAGFDPYRANRKLARARLALKLCGDASLVIDHLVKDQWEEFYAWYSGLKELAIEGPVTKKRRKIVIENGRVTINGKEPIRISKTVPEKERKDIEKLIADYYAGKAK